jgi:hypothetical protein
MTATERPSDSALAPIERDEDFDRSYIPLPGGWEIQTKGKGSTFRLCDPSGHRLAIPEQPYLFDTLERMARDIHAAHTRTLDAAPADPVVSAECWRMAVLEGCAIKSFLPSAEWFEQRARELAKEQSRGR